MLGPTFPSGLSILNLANLLVQQQQSTTTTNEKYMGIGKSSFCFILFRASPETFSHIQTNEQKIKEIKWKRND